jgi:hypothetical protein
MITIIGRRLFDPLKEGYSDILKIYDDNSMELWQGRFSSNPNPHQPNSEPKIFWQECYAQIMLGEYTYKVVTTDGKSYLHLRLYFSSSEKIPTTNPNKNHGGLHYAELVNIEKGFSPQWRGSKACQTIYPDDYPSFISHFKINDAGIYKLTD